MIWIKVKENPAQNGRNVQDIEINGDSNLQSYKNA